MVQNDNEVIVAPFNASSGCRGYKLVINREVKHADKVYTVIGIGESAFESNQEIRILSIPDTVKFIGEKAFYDCKELWDITIPKGVTQIGADAFFSAGVNSGKDMSISIPDSVTKIGARAFAGSNLVTLDSFSKNVTVIEDELFRGTRLQAMTILWYVTKIGKKALADSGKHLQKIKVYGPPAQVAEDAFDQAAFDQATLEVVVNPSENWDAYQAHPYWSRFKGKRKVAR